MTAGGHDPSLAQEGDLVDGPEHELPHLPVTQLGRNEAHSRQRTFHRGCEELMCRPNDPERAEVNTTGGVDDKGHHCLSLDAGLPQDVRVDRSC